MNVWNRVLISLIAVICVVFGIFAAKKYTMTKSEETKIEESQKRLAQALAELETLKFEIYGGSMEKKVGDWIDYGLDEQLKYVRSLQRGETFINCQPVEARVQSDEGSSSLSFVVDEQYQTSSFRTGAMVYVFDSGKPFVSTGESSESGESDGDESEVASAEVETADESGEVAASVKPFVFLGAYRVSGVAERQVKLDSIGVSTSSELDLITASKRSGDSWVVYVDNLPIDSPKDVARFTEQYTDIALGFSDENRVFMSKTFELSHVESSAAVSSEVEDGASEDEASEVAVAPVELPELTADSEMRYPVDFQGRFERLWCGRDAANVYKAKAEVALKVLTSLIADQYVMMGGDVDTSALASDEGWDETYAAAKGRLKSATLTDEIAARQKELATMENGRDLVKRLLDDAHNSINALQKAIADAVRKNAELASQISDAQFQALEKFEREEAQATASDSTKISQNEARL